MTIDSEPSLLGFNPSVIPYQKKVLKLLKHHDYSKGNLEILLSGSVGSAKSILMAHAIITHALSNPNSISFIGRKSLPDLKKTLWREVIDHISVDLKEGYDYVINRAELSINFRNGSWILTGSWADSRYKKFRSLKLSAIALEELTENNEDDYQAFQELKSRLRRLPKIKQNFLIAATNPDAPSHWVYKYFVEPNLNKEHETRKVFYSNGFENPFLDPVYVEQLKKDLPPKEARRLIYGEWVEIDTERLYSEYDTQRQYLKDQKYNLNPNLPVHMSFDFNIGYNKPMSAILFQYDPLKDIFHVYCEAIISNGRTSDIVHEFHSRGVLVKEQIIEINGDAAGKHRDTRSLTSDYDIIRKELANLGYSFTYNVPLANPPIRSRHNMLNAYCKNSLSEVRLYLYQGMKTLDEGLRLVQIKKGSSYVEDDSKPYQHVTTALGYGIMSTLDLVNRKPQRTIQL